MNIPTDKNPRIIVAEIAVRILGDASKVRSGFKPRLSKEQMIDLVGQIHSNVQQLKYSYLSLEDLLNSSQLQEIVSISENIFDAFIGAYQSTEAGKPRKITIQECTVLWACRLFINLPTRLQQPFRPTIESGVDMEVVGIRNIIPIPNSKLFISKVYNGSDDFAVVTNLQTLKAGMRVGVAYLPPVIIGGEISEAMYLGDEEYPDDVNYGTPIFDNADFGGVRNILKQEFMKKSK